MKNGFKTTEFWAAILAAMIPVVNKYFNTDLPAEAIAGLVAYIIGRCIVKAANKTT